MAPMIAASRVSPSATTIVSSPSLSRLGPAASPRPRGRRRHRRQTSAPSGFWKPQLSQRTTADLRGKPCRLYHPPARRVNARYSPARRDATRVSRAPGEVSIGVPHREEVVMAIDHANQEAAARILEGQPILTDVAPAADVIPGMERTLILHAGPPITWERMSGPLRGAVIGGLLYEGLARDEREAAQRAASGTVPTPPSTKAMARCCATGHTAPMCSTASAGSTTCWGRPWARHCVSSAARSEERRVGE